MGSGFKLPKGFGGVRPGSRPLPIPAQTQVSNGRFAARVALLSLISLGCGGLVAVAVVCVRQMLLHSDRGGAMAAICGGIGAASYSAGRWLR